MKDKKYEEELAEDIMKILTCYSARYYGARGGRKKKIKVENEQVESNGIWKTGNEKEANLIFYLLHQIVGKCKIIDELRNETKYRWSK